MLTTVEGVVQLMVDRSYKVGEPILSAGLSCRCGPQPNSKLLINYGFVDEDNSYDRILVEASLSTEDPQYHDKRMVAQRNRKLAVQVFQKSFWYPFIRELDRQRGRVQLAAESPLLWSEDELAYLTGSPTKQRHQFMKQ
ncbi:hypothetical protein C5167_041210 [Papaver somniferum]|uniref:Rubisco LSMT substrate-binding domain-containing protein n=1 Tax=Papaver somniferum TaxID=3469 RepID=A0A4Y7IJI6_PAPSO|nr:hypothetical protein C5167_041210 [Papaver somniferum]